MMKYQYYEICIGPGPYLAEDDSNFWMCVRGVRKPTFEEAEHFFAEDVKNNGGNVLAVNHISEDEARGCYDLSNEDNWPVFGKEDD